MADLKDLFSKFHSNRLKHQRRYDFTIEKYDQEIDDSIELDLDNDFNSEKIDSSEDDQDETEEESDNDELNLEKKYVSNYCNEIKRCMTSTPLYQDTIPIKSTILNGISPFLQSIKKNKPTNKQSNNILNAVRERNLLNKINNLTTPKLDERNQSAILCKPNEKINSHPFSQKLDFDFELSDDENNDEEEKGKNSVKKVPNMFQSPVLSSHKNISNLSPPSPNDKLKEMLDRFCETSKNGHQIQDTNFLAKIHQDMELSLPSQNDELKEICVQFSQEKSAKTTEKKSPIIELNKVQSEKISSLEKIALGEESDEENDKLSDLVEKFKKNNPKLNFMQSTPMAPENIQMEKLDISGLPIATPNEKMKKLADSQESDKLSDLVKKFKKNNPKLNFMQSTPMMRENVHMENLDISGLPNATPNDKMKKLCDIIQEHNEMDHDENDLVPEMSKKFVHNKKALNSNSTPRTSLSKYSKKINSDKLSVNEQMMKKFKNVKKPSVTESTPNPLSKSYQRNQNYLGDISNLSVRNNGNQIDISASDSLNDEMPKQSQKKKEVNMNKSNGKANLSRQNESREHYEIFKKKKNIPDLNHNDKVMIVGEKKSKNEVILQKENLVEKKKSSKNLIKINDKKSEKRILNLSNVSMEAKKPDFKKICLEHYQNKVLEKLQQDNSKNVTLLHSSKKFDNKKRPDIYKMCVNKFKQAESSNEKKTMIISKASCFLGREFIRDSQQKQSIV